ncbi:MAG: CsbD family protein [Terracidiphilus sp.]
MNKDRVKGAIDEVVGSAKRKAGELTGDTPLQIKGIAQQAKGKLEGTWGKAKEAVSKANQETKMQHNPRGRVAHSTAKS